MTPVNQNPVPETRRYSILFFSFFFKGFFLGCYYKFITKFQVQVFCKVCNIKNKTINKDFMVLGRLSIQHGFPTVNKTSLTSISWGGRGGLGCLIHVHNGFILPCVPKNNLKITA